VCQCTSGEGLQAKRPIVVDMNREYLTELSDCLLHIFIPVDTNKSLEAPADSSVQVYYCNPTFAISVDDADGAIVLPSSLKRR
jgi:hypothetical protein